MSKVISEQIPLGSSVISDSTAPGSGAREFGVAHVFPK